jgi:hypothetical protein
MKLSQQAMACVMMALQKSLMEQTDIVPVLKGFDLFAAEVDGEQQLVVSNPPTSISFSKTEFVGK